MMDGSKKKSYTELKIILNSIYIYFKTLPHKLAMAHSVNNLSF